MHLQGVGSAQKFLSTHAACYNIFNVNAMLASAQTHGVRVAARRRTAVPQQFDYSLSASLSQTRPGTAV